MASSKIYIPFSLSWTGFFLLPTFVLRGIIVASQSFHRHINGELLLKRLKLSHIFELVVILKPPHLITNFTDGVKKTLIYYIIGFGIAYLVSLIPGVAYGHGPGLHHIIGFLILAGGVIWAVYSLIRIIQNKKDRMNLASLILNVIVIAGVWLYLAIIINKESNESISPQKKDIITVYYDSSKKKIVSC